MDAAAITLDAVAAAQGAILILAFRISRNAAQPKGNPAMSDLPIADAAAAAITPPAPPALRGATFLGRVHHDVALATAVFGRIVPELARIATNPDLDEAVQLLANAAGLGAEAHDLAPVLAVLRDLVARKQAEQAAPPPVIADDGQLPASIASDAVPAQ